MEGHSSTGEPAVHQVAFAHRSRSRACLRPRLTRFEQRWSTLSGDVKPHTRTKHFGTVVMLLVGSTLLVTAGALAAAAIPRSQPASPLQQLKAVARQTASSLGEPSLRTALVFETTRRAALDIVSVRENPARNPPRDPRRGYFSSSCTVASPAACAPFRQVDASRAARSRASSGRRFAAPPISVWARACPRRYRCWVAQPRSASRTNRLLPSGCVRELKTGAAEALDARREARVRSAGSY